MVLGLAAAWGRARGGGDAAVFQVYTIISIQLLITVAIIAIFTFV